MAEVYALTDAHLSINQPDEEIISLLRGALERAERGDVTGLGIYWIEGQNDILVSVIPGCARGALMVAGSSRLYDETKKRW